VAKEIADEMVAQFVDDNGFGELHVIYTRFKTMVSQEVTDLRLLPLSVVEDDDVTDGEIFPLYDFEPSSADVLNALLPRYIRTQVHNCMLQSAASELAARQRAMHTATENAEDLINDYTRLANQARQAEITQEISEIVSGADALKQGA
jgi:F-type H+-transporting ATPase subunit gamma